ncbi:hypothetical protein PGT21_017142 [Puccinia graminis f. sp. tritici]|uniref:Uncharacterized protein n=1 Tax=Puccinia graminis f. sp. tritici TaxID=56615 RepID=A0A5B0QII1_PUCGR|nr:hypothetical protein PGT21_017142 [Puccinia graminis f. sp. tritici]
MPDLPKPIPNPEPVRGLTGFFRICGVRVGTLPETRYAMSDTGGRSSGRTQPI